MKRQRGIPARSSWPLAGWAAALPERKELTWTKAINSEAPYWTPAWKPSKTVSIYFALVPEEGRGHTADLLKAEIPKFVDLAARMETRFRDPDVFNAEAMDSAS